MTEDHAVKWFAEPAQDQLPPWATEQTDEHPQITGPADRAPLLTTGQRKRANATPAIRWTR
jgi:hypothetical protein